MKNQLITTAIKMALENEYSHVLELGVYRGKSLKIIRSGFSKEYTVFGFDSFQGLPEAWKNVHGKQIGKGFKGRFDTQGGTPNIKGVIFYSGWFEDTIPEYKRQFDAESHPVSLLHLDCDLYSSTKEALWGLNDYIRPSTVILFDDWVYAKQSLNEEAKKKGERNRTPDPQDAIHQQKAYYKWVAKFDRECELSSNKNPSDWAKKIAKVIR